VPELRIAIVTFDQFNELDSLIALHMFGRVRGHGLRAEIVAPSPDISSLYGVHLRGVQPIEWAKDADAVLFGSGRGNRQAILDPQLMERVRPDRTRQLVGSQCSGALVLHRLGLVGEGPICTDNITRRAFVELGVPVVDRPFLLHDGVAMAGGCFSAQYLASWVIRRLCGEDQAREALQYVAPVGEAAQYVQRMEAALAAASE
jgi:transcriptional regulator GlxA family with amidase domain